MQFPVGLLLLTSTLLLHDACCKTIVRSSSVEEDDASGDAITEAGSHIGDVVMTDGEETEPYVEKSDLHNGSLEAILFGLTQELSEDGVEIPDEYALLELAKEYENGTRKGVPTYHHSPLDMANPRDRRTDKRQAYPANWRWEKAILPYKFSDDLPTINTENAKATMREYEKMTCLRFPPWSETVHAEYNLTGNTFIVWSLGNCASGIGVPSRGAAPFSGCTTLNIGLHELGHRIGFHHEQNHQNRDLYITIHPENAVDPYTFRVNTLENALGGTEVHPYDYGSRMHYGLFSDSGTQYPTMQLRDKRDSFLVSNNLGAPFSHYDWMGVNKYYECADKCPAEKKLECQNDGYLTEHCECACPQGFSGQVCERLINSNCGGIFELSESNLSVKIASPGYPQSNNTEECMWYIKSAEKDKELVLDIHDLELQKEGTKCLDSLEVRRTLIAQPGERFCGKGARTSISYGGFIILVLRFGKVGTTGLKSGFSSRVRLVSEKEQCYSTADSGSSYRGKVDYSQLYHKCIPWEKAQHCEVNLFSPKYTHSGLSGHSYCRNPNNLMRPWCYVNVECSFDSCDVCGVAQCYDINADCVEATTTDPKYCSTDMGFRMCHKTCNFCGRGHEKPVSSCSKPDMTGKNAVIDPSHENQATFKFGEKLKMDCKEKINDELITRQLTCTTDGKFVGDSLVCCNQQECNDGWTSYKDGCYKLVRTKTGHSTFDCEEAGGSLVSISDDAENNFVGHLIGGNQAWIGYSNLNTGKKFVWMDGVQRTYTNWRPKEPSFGENDNCTIMEIGGTWDDINCLDLHMGVCKKHNEAIEGNCSCADEYVKCAELIEENYKFCSLKYSLTYCRSSCGLCGTESFCKNPGPVADTIQKNMNESITNGHYFEYECSGSGYKVVSGNLGRGCLKDGTLSGSAPVCKPYVGHEAIQHNRVDASNNQNYMFIEHSSAMTFNKPGAIIGWRFFSNYPGNITMMVVRPVEGSATNVVVIWMKAMPSPNAKLALQELAESESIRVLAGDIIAWYYMPGSKLSIPYSDCSSKDAKVMYYGRGPFTVGNEVTGTESALCREYAIGAVMDYGPLVVCNNPDTVPNAFEKTPVQDLFEYECISGYKMTFGSRYRACLKNGTLSGTTPVCIESNGHDAVPTSYIDYSNNINYMYMERSSAMTFNRPETIKAWRMYSTSAADITIMVVRPVEGSDTKFKIVGMNTMKTPNGTAAVIPVATADRISVEAGDIIAWYYMPGSDPTLPFSGCDSDVKIMYFGPGPFEVGQEASGTWTRYRGPCRQYSIGAVMENREAHFGHLPRGIVDYSSNINYMYMERSSSMTFDGPGTIKEWMLYSTSAADITMVVLRPIEGSGTKCKVAGMNAIKTPNGTAAVIPVPTADRISVEAGDIIAWYYMPGSDPTIPFYKCSSIDVKILWFGPGPFKVGQEASGKKTGKRGPCRQYSIGGFMEYGEQSVGHDAIPQSNVDYSENIDYMYMERFSSMTFDRPGTIKEWMLYSTSVANITMVVLRPLEGSDNKFKIVGMNTMKTPNGTAAVIPVVTADRISVEAGDIIAWYYMPGSDPTIPFYKCDSPDVEILWFGGGPFKVGQEAFGKWTGKRGPCRQYSIGAFMEYGEVSFGHDGVPHSLVDSSSNINYMYIEHSSSMTFNGQGTIKAWKLYSTSTVDITMLIVRPVKDSDTKFKIVGMNPMKTPNGKAAVIPVATADRISVEAGDILAWYYMPGSNPTIPFRKCDSDDVKIMWFGPGPFKVGQEASGTVTSYNGPCRQYSIGAVIEKGQARIGHDALPCSSIDFSENIKYMYIERSSSMTFNRPGTIKAWKMYSTSVAEIAMVIVRPVEGSDTKFKVVGMNTMKTPNGTAAVIPVPTADRISVEAGDIIAWYYMPGSDPTIPFGQCDSEDVKILWAGPGPFKVGQEASGTVTDVRGSCLQYSVGAVMETGEALFGHDALQHSKVDFPDNIEYMYIERSSSMTFNRQGEIKAWEMYSTSAAEIAMVVVRPVEGSDTTFKIVGINTMKTPNGTAAVIPVATADRISVEAGDIIAWYYMPGSNPTIPFTKCGASYVKILSAGPGPFSVGQEASGTVIEKRGPCRQYSIGAVMEYETM